VPGLQQTGQSAKYLPMIATFVGTFELR
jgi:hypothetical protein